MSRKPEPKPFFPVRNDFLPALENFVAKAMNLYTATDILTGDSMGVSVDFPGKDRLRQAVDEFRSAAFSDETD